MIRFDSEAELESFVFDNIDSFAGSITVGGPPVSHHRQLSLPGYGLADIVAIEQSGFDDDVLLVSVIELKNVPLTKSHLAQLCRYMNYFAKLSDEISVDIDVHGFLVGPKTFGKSDTSDDVFLMQAIDKISVVEFGLCPESGFELKLVDGWCKVKFDEADHSEVAALLQSASKGE
jgi:hypothetical protein